MANPKSQIPNPKQIPITEIPMFKRKTNFEFGDCNFGFICNLVLVIWCLSFLVAGCASLKEGAKGFAGISTKVLEDGRRDAVKIVLGCAYSECYDKVLEKLKKIGTHIYFEDKNKQMIAFYLHNAGQAEAVVTQTGFTITDTTPVGIFFSEIDPKNTRVEVSSPGTYAREFIAAEISAILEKTDEKK